MFRGRLRGLLALVAVSALLMAYQARNGAISPFSFLSAPFNAVNSGITSVSSSLSSFFMGLTGNRGELEDLRAEVMRLKAENMGLKEAALEAGRLRELLSLKETRLDYFTSARVITRGSDPWSRTVVIDKGSSDLISRGMAVITPAGLAGKVHRVFDSYSIVLLADDRRFRAAARLEASRTEGIYSGTGSRRQVIEFVDPKAGAGEGEIVVTSGLDGLFPPGISIGYVSKASKPERKLFQDVEVRLFADTGKIEEVAVLR